MNFVDCIIVIYYFKFNRKITDKKRKNSNQQVRDNSEIDSHTLNLIANENLKETYRDDGNKLFNDILIMYLSVSFPISCGLKQI